MRATTALLITGETMTQKQQLARLVLAYTNGSLRNLPGPRNAARRALLTARAQDVTSVPQRVAGIGALTTSLMLAFGVDESAYCAAKAEQLLFDEVRKCLILP
jgi:hypothetical protein